MTTLFLDLAWAACVALTGAGFTLVAVSASLACEVIDAD